MLVTVKADETYLPSACIRFLTKKTSNPWDWVGFAIGSLVVFPVCTGWATISYRQFTAIPVQLSSGRLLCRLPDINILA